SIVVHAGAGAAQTPVVEFGAMAYVPRTSGTRLVQVSAVGPGYPYYGELTSDPLSAWNGLQNERSAVVEPSLLASLAAQVGDTLALGNGRFVIRGVTAKIPGDVGIRAALGPRVFIAQRWAAATGLLGFGARADYNVFVRLPESVRADPIAERLRPELREIRVRVRTVANDQANLDRTLSRLTDYLGLVGLVALLLGGLGVASAMFVYVRRKLDSVAVLRCLGATAGDVFGVFLLQAAAMGLAGSILGAVLGAVVQQVLPTVLADFLPVDVIPALSWPALIIGVGIGIGVALLFAGLPLLEVRRVPPLAALRRDVMPAPSRRDPWRWGVVVLLAVSLTALAAYQAGSWVTGIGFSIGVALSLVILWAAAKLLLKLLRHRLPARWPYVWRQGLANLYRPANQTVGVVLALGFGTFLLATILLVQATLLRGLDLGAGTTQPNLVLFDIQTDQRAPLADLLRERQLPVQGPVPIVPMRIQSINGRATSTMLADTLNREGGHPSGWALRREYRSTYRDTMVATEQITAGRWWTGATKPGDLAQISVETDLAGELGIGLGDTLVWDVQGLAVPTRVTSLREVDWARFEPNFFVVFQPGVLEPAPQTDVLLTHVADATERGRLQRTVVERFPNVTTIDLSLVLSAVERLVSRVVLAIRFMALFTLASGALVLIGAVAGSRRQRVREGALLRTIGAARGQVRRIVLAEYLTLGALAAITGLVLAGIASWALAHFLFDMRFQIPALPLLLLAAGVVGLTLVVGLAGSRPVVRQAPLAVLRGEE
ncbi:MAG TPA: FtsX-like permease family protein, partial [Gemmatimonadales bacterium]|nr:FtsX-like permease family protein [Gemmatimonadales bacterium]